MAQLGDVQSLGNALVDEPIRHVNNLVPLIKCLSSDSSEVSSYAECKERQDECLRAVQGAPSYLVMAMPCKFTSVQLFVSGVVSGHP